MLPINVYPLVADRLNPVPPACVFSLFFHFLAYKLFQDFNMMVSLARPPCPLDKREMRCWLCAKCWT